MSKEKDNKEFTAEDLAYLKFKIHVHTCVTLALFIIFGYLNLDYVAIVFLVLTCINILRFVLLDYLKRMATRMGMTLVELINYLNNK